MALLKRLPTVLLWVVTLVSVLFGLLALASTLGFIRFAVISDSSSAPTAFKWSLEIAQQVDSVSVEDGDTILVGSHSAKASTLGEVVHVTKSETGDVSVTLRAPSSDLPDEWNYELGKTTHSHLLAIPLLGYPLDKLSSSGGLMGLACFLFLGVLVGLRFLLFRKTERDGDPWFKKLEPEYNQDNLEVLGEIFVMSGSEAPQIYSKKVWWHRMRKQNPAVATAKEALKQEEINN